VKVLHSTQAGSVRAGESIRLVLELAVARDAPAEVQVGTSPRIAVRL
jgi:hypothetical protein